MRVHYLGDKVGILRVRRYLGKAHRHDDPPLATTVMEPAKVMARVFEPKEICRTSSTPRPVAGRQIHPASGPTNAPKGRRSARLTLMPAT